MLEIHKAVSGATNITEASSQHHVTTVKILEQEDLLCSHENC
jgi:hypothetical protein